MYYVKITSTFNYLLPLYKNWKLLLLNVDVTITQK